MPSLSAQKLLSNAKKESGLTDFGDTSFLEGLEILVQGLNKRNDLLEDRIEVMGNELVRILVNRLRMMKDVNEHPEIAEQELVPPVLILALPRTGSSKLQRIMSLNDDFQDLPLWQCLMPSRIPGMPNQGIEQRIARTQEFCDWRLSVVPGFQQGHPVNPLESDELVNLQEMTFCSTFHMFHYASPEYAAWFSAQDMTAAWKFTRLTLQYLQWQFSPSQEKPKPWLIKDPGSFGCEDVLNNIFPQGQKIICLHRDTAKIAPSACHALETVLAPFYEMSESTRPALGQNLIGGFSYQASQHIAWRKRNPSIELLDLSFNEINAPDSVGLVEKVYEFLNMPVSEEAKHKIRKWDQENPRDKYGKKSPIDPATYGLTQDMMDSAFAEYREHFGDYL